jgi:hypothetical protein
MPSKPSTVRDPDNVGFLLVEWESQTTGRCGVEAVETEKFSSWRAAEAGVFDTYHGTGLMVKSMCWAWGELP